MPSLLAIGAVHHHLIRRGLRTLTSLVVEAGDIRETHHFCSLIGYGATCVNPYMVHATIAAEQREHGHLDASMKLEKMIDTFNKVIGKSILKVMSKNGISTLQSYQGAQIFEILGISNEVVEKCFTGSVSRIQGISYDGIAEEVLARHAIAFPEMPLPGEQLEVGGVYQWKRRGEGHLFNPKSIHHLQVASRKNDFQEYKKYASIINEQTEQALTLRGLLTFRKGNPIPIEEVEPVENIMKRFATGAMSFGSISHEAHSTLRIAMNRIWRKSNSGEGGEGQTALNPKKMAIGNVRPSNKWLPVVLE